MTLADTNFWLAITISGHDFHETARDWFDRQPAGQSVLLCRATQQSLLRLLTTEAVLRPYGVPPLTNAGAWKVYEGLASDGRVAWVAEADPNGIQSRWKKLAAGAGAASPKLWMDAYLAAFALAGGHRLVTTDRAFRQFPGLDAIILTETHDPPHTRP